MRGFDVRRCHNKATFYVAGEQVTTYTWFYMTGSWGNREIVVVALEGSPERFMLAYLRDETAMEAAGEPVVEFDNYADAEQYMIVVNTLNVKNE